MKILIFGNGQVGNLYNNYFKNNANDLVSGFESQIAKADITDKAQIEEVILEFGPNVVINTAAKTNLEWCSQNKLEAFNVNVLGADNIAQVCDKRDIYFIHFSSGCIFESKNESDVKTEDSIPNPAAYYSFTKVWAEQIIQFDKNPDFKFLILRPRQPVSSEVNYKNMLVKFLTFTKFVDTPNTGTVLEDMLDWTAEIIKKQPIGTLNLANEGWTTPYKIAELLRKHVLPELPIELITKEELDKLTPNRRVDTILDVSKLKTIVSNVGKYEDRLEDTIRKLGENFRTLDKKLVENQLEKTLAQSRQRTVVNDVWPNLIKR